METTSKASTIEFLTKIPNRKKISNEDFNFCEVETFLDEIIKSINSQKIINLQVMMSLKQYFINTFINTFQMN